MAFTSEYVALTLRWIWMGQQMQSKRYFKATGAAYFGSTPEQLGEAYWNHVKAAWRALVPAGASNTFQSVLIEEVGGILSFGEFAIPTLEKSGTRSNQAGDESPSFVNVGIRYTVATRLTRPGQMRIPFLYEADTLQNSVQSGFLTLCNALADVYDTDMTLGVPVATAVLRMQVTRQPDPKNPATWTYQPVVGHVTNGLVTSQISRKAGRGS